jgi:hypothetical protein
VIDCRWGDKGTVCLLQQSWGYVLAPDLRLNICGGMSLTLMPPSLQRTNGLAPIPAGVDLGTSIPELRAKCIAVPGSLPYAWRAASAGNGLYA